MKQGPRTSVSVVASRLRSFSPTSTLPVHLPEGHRSILSTCHLPESKDLDATNFAYILNYIRHGEEALFSQAIGGEKVMDVSNGVRTPSPSTAARENFVATPDPWDMNEDPPWMMEWLLHRARSNPALAAK